MTFPRLMVITDGPHMTPNYSSAILNACLGGAKWFCVREKNLSAREQLEALRETARVAEKFGAQTFAHDRADLARAAHSDGLHLSERGLPADAARISLSFHTPLGVSVHSLETAMRAQTEGANYVVFGPVFATNSHPGQEPAGLDALQEITQALSIPVFAVGGITASNAASCLEHGAAGVAVISAIWNSDNATQAVRELRAALGEVDAPRHGSGEHASPLAGLIRREG